MKHFGIQGDDAEEVAMDQMHDGLDSGLKSEISYDGKDIHVKIIEDLREENSTHAEDEEE